MKQERQQEDLLVHVEPGMVEQQVCNLQAMSELLARGCVSFGYDDEVVRV